MVETLINSFGNSIAVGIRGQNAKEAEEAYYVLWLHKVVLNLEPHSPSDTFLWNWSNKTRIIEGFINKRLNEVWNKLNGMEIQSEKALNRIKQEAEKYFLDLKKNHSENFVYIKHQTKDLAKNNFFELKEHSNSRRTARPSDEIVIF